MSSKHYAGKRRKSLDLYGRVRDNEGMDKQDQVCQTCKLKKDCKGTCAPMVWINGNKPLKESIMRDPIDCRGHGDYNEVLHNLIRSKQDDTKIEDIRMILDERIRSIAAMLHAHMPITSIARQLHLSRKHLHHLINHPEVTPSEE